MQKFSRLFVLACATIGASVTWAQSVAPGSALAFGSFAPGGGSGTVTISAASARSSAGVFLVPSGSGSAASFTVSGTSGATYSITLPGNGVVSLTSGTNSMAVNNFTSSPAATSPSTGLLTGGTQTLMVGATLTVAGNQAVGSYSGNFTVTVVYP